MCDVTKDGYETGPEIQTNVSVAKMSKALNKEILRMLVTSRHVEETKTSEVFKATNKKRSKM